MWLCERQLDSVSDIPSNEWYLFRPCLEAHYMEQHGLYSKSITHLLSEDKVVTGPRLGLIIMNKICLLRNNL